MPFRRNYSKGFVDFVDQTLNPPKSRDMLNAFGKSILALSHATPVFVMVASMQWMSGSSLPTCLLWVVICLASIALPRYVLIHAANNASLLTIPIDGKVRYLNPMLLGLGLMLSGFRIAAYNGRFFVSHGPFVLHRGESLVVQLSKNVYLQVPNIEVGDIAWA